MTKIKTNKKTNEVEVFRENDLYLGEIIQVEVSATMYAYEFKPYTDVTLTSSELTEISQAIKKLR